MRNYEGHREGTNGDLRGLFIFKIWFYFERWGYVGVITFGKCGVGKCVVFLRMLGRNSCCGAELYYQIKT